MKFKPCHVQIVTNIVIMLPFPPTPQDATRELEKLISTEVLKNARITVNPILEPMDNTN